MITLFLLYIWAFTSNNVSFLMFVFGFLGDCILIEAIGDAVTKIVKK